MLDGNGGASTHVIAPVLGHKGLRMATRYQQLSPEFSATVSKLDGFFLQVETPKPGSEISADRQHSVTKLLDAGQEVVVSD